MPQKILGMMLILAGTSSLALAGGDIVAPELDPAMAVSGLAILSGALLVIRSRRKK